MYIFFNYRFSLDSGYVKSERLARYLNLPKERRLLCGRRVTVPCWLSQTFARAVGCLN